MDIFKSADYAREALAKEAEKCDQENARKLIEQLKKDLVEEFSDNDVVFNYW